MGSITCKIEDLQPSKKNRYDLVLPIGKIIIISGATQAISGKPGYWKVSIEITKELDKVRFGKITEIKEVYIMTDEVFTAWKKAFERGCSLDSSKSKILGREYNTDNFNSFWLKAFEPDKKYCVISLRKWDPKTGYRFAADYTKDDGTDWQQTFPCTMEGVEAYEKALIKFIEERALEWQKLATERMNILMEKQRSGWIAGKYRMLYAATAYHDGFGPESDSEISACVACEYQDYALMNPACKEVPMDYDDSVVIRINFFECQELQNNATV